MATTPHTVANRIAMVTVTRGYKDGVQGSEGGLNVISKVSVKVSRSGSSTFSESSRVTILKDYMLCDHSLNGFIELLIAFSNYTSPRQSSEAKKKHKNSVCVYVGWRNILLITLTFRVIKPFGNDQSPRSDKITANEAACSEIKCISLIRRITCTTEFFVKTRSHIQVEARSVLEYFFKWLNLHYK